MYPCLTKWSNCSVLSSEFPPMESFAIGAHKEWCNLHKPLWSILYTPDGIEINRYDKPAVLKEKCCGAS